MFAFHLLRKSHSGRTFCFIRKNRMRTAAYVEVAGDTDSYQNRDQSSTSVILQLDHGDVVDVGGCLDVNSISSFSTFNGFLLRAN